jgi:hypothetical protein
MQQLVPEVGSNLKHEDNAQKKMESQQIMERLLAMREDRKADQAKADARHKEMKANQAKTDASQVQLREEIRANQAKL